MDVQALDAEIAAVKASFKTTWADLAVFLRAKIAESATTGGVISYTLNGRSVTRDTKFLQEMLIAAEKRIGGGMRIMSGEFPW